MINRFEQYLLIEKRYSEHTSVAYLKDVDQFMVFAELTFTDLLEVRASLIRSWVVHLFDQGVAKKSINRKLSSLRTFFKWLKKESLIVSNPLVKVTGPKNEKRLPQFAKESDLKLEKLEPIFSSTFEGLRDRLMFEIFYQTGIRLSEWIGLKDGDVQSNTIKVLGKRNKERLIPISFDLSKLINEYKIARSLEGIDTVNLLVLKNGNKLYPKFVYRRINDYLSSATNLDKTSPHVLRHTFATHMLNNGAGLETLKELLGHANLSATQIYTHNSFAQLTSIYSQAHPRGHKN
jgi:integrase/recombinase XerC